MSWTSWLSGAAFPHKIALSNLLKYHEELLVSFFFFQTYNQMHKWNHIWPLPRSPRSVQQHCSRLHHTKHLKANTSSFCTPLLRLVLLDRSSPNISRRSREGHEAPRPELINLLCNSLLDFLFYNNNYRFDGLLLFSDTLWWRNGTRSWIKKVFKSVLKESRLFVLRWEVLVGWKVGVHWCIYGWTVEYGLSPGSWQLCFGCDAVSGCFLPTILIKTQVFMFVLPSTQLFSFQAPKRETFRKTLEWKSTIMKTETFGKTLEANAHVCTQIESRLPFWNVARSRNIRSLFCCCLQCTALIGWYIIRKTQPKVSSAV